MRRSAAFTMIEILAVLLLMSMLVGAALNAYVDISNRTHAAADSTRQWRQGAALLDRVAAELERAYLVKLAEGEDPLYHPWIFRAEARYSSDGSDQLLFMVRRPLDLAATDGPRRDISLVSYMVRPPDGFDAEDEGYELLRWSDDAAPETSDIDFPNPSDAQLVADGIAEFRVILLDDQGGEHETWDSAQLGQTGTLPAAATIEVAFVPPPGQDESPLPVLSRPVRLPLPAIDLALLADPAAYSSGAADEEDDQDDDGDEMACDCLDRTVADENGRSVLDSFPGTPQEVQQIADRLCEIPWSQARQWVGTSDHPGILCD